ncbi:MAG: four helix bundle protein [Sphingobacteriales bacterium]|nr:MAG: four helix bundle protein [Sphingobacteriales bacterium]
MFSPLLAVHAFIVWFQSQIMAQYRLEELEVYQLALAFANKVWDNVITWDKFARYHPGPQFTEAADSISANIAESYGRFHFREKLNFCYIARGSIVESKDWIAKAAHRQLLSDVQEKQLLEDLALVHEKLNGYIKHLRKTQ